MQYFSKNFSALSLALLVSFLFTLAGCSGGGGGSSIVSSPGGGGQLGVRAAMIDAQGNGFEPPASALGKVVVTATGRKGGAAITRAADYNSGSLTFQNDIPTGDTYTVTVVAALRFFQNETREVVWAGTSEVFIHSNDALAKDPSLNQTFVPLKFSGVRLIPLYAASLRFDPSRPVEVVAPGTQFPDFYVSVLDQFGNALDTAADNVTLSFEGGAFRDASLTTAKASGGRALFSGLVAGRVTPDTSGSVRFRAVYGSVSGVSSNIPAAASLIPNTTLAGFMTDPVQPSGSSAVALSRAPIANATFSIFVDNVEYGPITTDSEGYWKMDVRVNAALARAMVVYRDGSGKTFVSETGVERGKVYLSSLKVDPVLGTMVVRKAELSVPFGSITDASDLKKAVRDEIARIRSAAGGVTRIGGRILVDGGTAPVDSARVTIDQAGASAETNSEGVFVITGLVLKAGRYTVNVYRDGFLAKSFEIVVIEDDYGFGYEGIVARMARRPNSPPSVSAVFVSGQTNEVVVAYSLADNDGDLCSVGFSYSTDSGATYRQTANIIGDLSGVTPGSGKAIRWLSLNDIKTNQTGVMVRLTPNDGKNSGQPSYYGPFELFNAAEKPSVPPAAANVRVSGTSEVIMISYDLITTANVPAAIEVHYSLDGGATYSRTFNVAGDISGVPGGAGKSIAWNSYSDFKTAVTAVRIKLIPSNSFGTGLGALSAVFAVDNFRNSPPVLRNVSVSGRSRAITIKYDLFDKDNDPCSVSFAFSKDGGATYIRSQNFAGDVSAVTPGAGKVAVWASRLDIPGNEPAVTLLVRAADPRGAYTEEVTLPFEVANMIATPSIGRVETFGDSGDIAVAFAFVNPDGVQSSVEVSFSTDGGANFIKSPNFSPGSESVALPGVKSIVWHSYQDVRANVPGVLLKLVPYGPLGAGTEAVSLPFALRNDLTRPAVRNVSVSFSPSDSSEVVVRYDLVDAEGSLCTIETIFKPEGLPVGPARAVSGDVMSVAPGKGRTILWRSALDFKSNSPNVVLGLVPIDAGGRGSLEVSLPFALNNNRPPVVSNLVRSGNSNAIAFTYDLSDAESDICTVEVWLSKNGGTTFNRTLNIQNIVQTTGSIVPGAGKTFTWASQGDIQNAILAGVVIRVIPKDRYGAGQPVDTTPFQVNNVVIIPTTLQSAEFISDKKMLLRFSAAVSGTPDITKFGLSGVALGGSDYSVSLVNSDSAVITHLTSVFLAANSGLSAASGLTIAQGCGVNGPSGEVTPVTMPVAVGRDFTALAPQSTLLQKLAFSNANGTVRATAPLQYSESGYLVVYAGTLDPNSNSVAANTESVSVASHASAEIIISSIPAKSSGDSVWYRFKDMYGNLSSWSQSGTVPAPPPAGPLVWRSWQGGLFVTAAFNLAPNEKIRVYEFDGSTIYTLMGSTAPSVTGGFTVGHQYTGASIAGTQQVVYTAVNQYNNESARVNDGEVPPPVGPPMHLRAAYSSGGYEIFNNGSSFNPAYDMRVYIEKPGSDEVLIGRIDSSLSPTIANGTYVGAGKYVAAESASADALKETVPQGGNLVFTYVTANGNESLLASYSNVPSAPDPAYLGLQNSASSYLNVQAGYPGGAIGNTGLTFITYTGTGGTLSSFGTYPFATNIPAGGGFIACGLVTSGHNVAYSIKTGDGNESVRVQDGTIPAPPPDSTLAVQYDPSGNYKLRNISGSAYVSSLQTRVYIASNLKGTLGPANIAAGAYSTETITPDPAGGSLVLRAYAPGSGNASAPNSSVDVPAAANVAFAGLTGAGKISVNGSSGDEMTALSGNSVIKVYRADDGAGTNMAFHRQTDSAPHNSFSALYDANRDATGNIAAPQWVPIPSGKYVGYVVVDPATGNWGSIAFDGTVPPQPSAGDLSNLKYVKAQSEVRATAIVGDVVADDLKLAIFEKTAGPTYSSKGTTGVANGANGFNSGVLIGSLPSLADGSGVSYAYVNSNGNFSEFADDGTVPAPPVTDSLRLRYEMSDAVTTTGNYKVVNTGAPQLDVPASTRLNVFIGVTLAGFQNGPSTITGSGGYSTLNVTPNSAGGLLKFRLEDANGNESSDSPGSPTSVPPAPSAAENFDKLRVRFDAGAFPDRYKIFNTHTGNVTVDANYNCRIFIGNKKAGRVESSTVIANNSFLGSYFGAESLSVDELFKNASFGGGLKFLYISTLAPPENESAFSSAWTAVPEAPSFSPSIAGKSLNLSDVALRYNGGNFDVKALNNIDLDATFASGKIILFDGVNAIANAITLDANGDFPAGFGSISVNSASYGPAFIPKYVVGNGNGNESIKSVPDGKVLVLTQADPIALPDDNTFGSGDRISMSFGPGNFVDVLAPMSGVDFYFGGGSFNPGAATFPGTAPNLSVIEIIVGAGAALDGAQLNNKINIVPNSNVLVDHDGGNTVKSAPAALPVAGFTATDF